MSGNLDLPYFFVPHRLGAKITPGPKSHPLTFLVPLRFIKNRGPISVLKYIATFSPLATIVAKFAKCPSPEALSVCFEPVFGLFTR